MERMGRTNESIAARCVIPTSCNQLDCPIGFTCVNETQGSTSTHGRASCQASCNDVQCPEFLQCVEEGSTTECVIPDACALVECPFGTDCVMVEKDDMSAAICLGQSCDSIECFDGSECFATNSSSLDTLVNILNGRSSIVARDSSRSDVHTSGFGSGSSVESNTGSSTGSSAEGSTGGSSGSLGRDIATCVPTCDGVDICPQGFVCEKDMYKLTCREAESCFEMKCPTGQECKEVPCGTRRARRSSTGTKPTAGTIGNVMVHCVDVVESTPSDTPPILERIGNEGAAAIGIGNGSGAGSLAATKQGTLVSVVAALAILALFLLHL